ncbi:ABC-type Mn/Zn transport system, ATPase component [Paenibacillus larvae subsp. larvae]|uniref:ABC-type Mn/Zn transport systems, ATPase component n=3 Tax=Paenibacillus larvae TaxID=1464 RepID=V9WD62_9BACL|nr:metal ABC transporter ATP-binding protein [Paenibacillus larvae]AHD07057.1 ABC-type Mn/Zn transport systems, ATPase component [Paenibacillus larvae subsp. larvae DSM 25430]AQT86136.1 ABC transporter [Paenibacillus larvae subsp. pulvifaciens]AQZ47745.1 ABC transporter [Paenibacillus larvae subsp. pulvifaciens]ARF69448.1 ABC transporter [Paenibacillus larvae subsp. pulvifaciens]AVF25624.1 ABC-type Mn/Zn transport system, ATPase component [Paenibacillus larvae subsp. larvae]
MNQVQAECHRSIVEIENVSFSYENKRVIEHLNAQILERDFVGLIGSNGAGKSTLLKMLVNLLKPDEGEIRLFGIPVQKFKDWEKIGYVPQKANFNPLFPATVREVVLSGLYTNKKMFKRLSKSDYQKGDDALLAMKIEDLAGRRIGQLSGGQQQRVFLARALVNNPELLILDEPTVGIDAETQADFFQMIRHMHQHHHMTFIMVSHDMDMMKSYLGDKPIHSCGKLNFHVRHTHDPQNCAEVNFAHSIGHSRDIVPSK